MKAPPYGNNIKNVPGGAHLGSRLIFIVWGCEQTLGANEKVLFFSWAGGISLSVRRALNVIVKNWSRLFELSNTAASKSMYLRSLCSAYHRDFLR